MMHLASAKNTAGEKAITASNGLSGSPNDRVS